MTRLTLLLLALAAPAHAWPNSGKTFTLTVPPGQTLASLSSNPLVHPMWEACKGPAGKVTRVILADGTKVYTGVCR